MEERAHIAKAHEGSIKAALSENSQIHWPSVPVLAPNGKEELLHFQWSRLHPMSIIAMSEQDASVAVRCSKRFSVYDNAAAARVKNGTSESSKSSSSKFSYGRPEFLHAGSLSIDICELLPEPVLMSDTIDAIFSDSEANS
jgi:hypothetical protein